MSDARKAKRAARAERAPPPARVTYRSRPRASDSAALKRLVASTGAFHPEELVIAVELIDERLEHGARSGYSFVFADCGAEVVGYSAWGKVPLTTASYDLYWIAVAPAWQGTGVGRTLLRLTERAVARRGGAALYIETSARADYARTRRFYRAAGYERVARLADFYAPGDHKIVYCKRLASSAS